MVVAVEMYALMVAPSATTKSTTSSMPPGPERCPATTVMVVSVLDRSMGAGVVPTSGTTRSAFEKSPDPSLSRNCTTGELLSRGSTMRSTSPSPSTSAGVVSTGVAPYFQYSIGVVVKSPLFGPLLSTTCRPLTTSM